MGIISWIVFGLIAGALAKFLFPGDDPGGCIVTIIIGVIGAIVGGFIMTQLGYGTVTGFNLYSFGVAILGSMVVLAIYRVLISGKAK
ncbi:GlsB/YeaQ/YmgE family stress response membrane protein [Blastopirellula marina]|uniref:GlsB/YeaQ/YmgE family stress response membrane protein n=1 Tax=Blastopirellula marina TaxID=124 RepID=A0A2S8FEP8_9BACT|nr:MULTISPECIES: GlsB/YeaQ/YmgE family stress response membrane protein [Pirellulaceae]PQO30651.1 GlsB/YeaQ/YmgE family stress response membrane protein [Blastopirellula marina]RCS50788.1 GlsB/YeaQ/YmgE family stress response membrane protein [Bremerella cremea]